MPIQPFTRRRILTLFPALAAMSRTPLFAQHIFNRKRKPQPVIQPLVYIGTDTLNSGARGIYLARFNPTTGQLSAPALAAETVRPSYLAAASVGKMKMLYAANEGKDEPSSGISAFTVNPATGALLFVNKVPASGPGPCYVSVDADGGSAFCANYAGSSIASFKLQPNGALSDSIEHISFKQKGFGHQGPNTARQDAPHPHSATLSPDNRFLVVCDLGNDSIDTFFIHPDTAKLGPPQLNPSRIPGTGPRHVAFHPNQRWVYGIDELSNKIDHFLWNATHGTSTTGPVALLTNTGNSVSTLDPGFHGPNTAAEIAISPDGDYILASNRGENSLVVFRIDAVTGAPSLVQRISCGGKTPRQFTLDETGRWLLCGNQDSGSITVFARNESTGQLNGPVQTIPIEMPQMVLFA
jgi:6-phosphogluconolactonase